MLAQMEMSATKGIAEARELGVGAGLFNVRTKVVKASLSHFQLSKI